MTKQELSVHGKGGPVLNAGHRARWRRQIRLALLSAVTCCIVLAIPAYADSAADGPAGGPNYPLLRYFSQIDPNAYAMSDPPGAALPDQPGYWFVTAQGLHCGIWFRGSFGCVGNIPGAPAGVDKLGWITGDTRVHYDWTLAIRFPPPRGTKNIPPLSSISVEGTTCATTAELSTYCERGPFRFLISSAHTWLN